MYDIIIRGGSLVDGTGAEPVLGDLAIKDGLIAAMGQVDGEAREVIDATGHTVTPGFIDTHTHLDAQIGWDPDMTPVSWHGVTTALIGNCGVTFAPCNINRFFKSSRDIGDTFPVIAICIPENNKSSLELFKSGLIIFIQLSNFSSEVLFSISRI